MINRYILFLLLAVLVSVSSCDNGFEELNINPNEPTAVPTSYLLAAAQKGLMDNLWDEWWNGRRGNQLAQYWSSNQYSNESRYQLRVQITNTYWGNFYAGGTDGGGLIDLNEIIRLCTDDPDGNTVSGDPQNQIAVAKILQSWTFLMMSDCWGSIPYSESLNGTEIQQPVYDSQSEVYEKVLGVLKEAASDIKLDASGPSGDNIFNGDMAKWKKFANSLRLRAAIRMSDVDAGSAETHVSEAIAGGVMESNDDSALYNYAESAPDNNPINEDKKTRNDFAASNIMVDYLKDLNDPRLSFFYEPTVSSSEFVGEVYGLTEDDAATTPNSDVSQRSELVLKGDFPGIFLDYAQVEFLLAEAAERGLGGATDAEAHYNNGITASMNFWNTLGGGSLTADDISGYIDSEKVSYSSAEGDWKTKIGRQKWVALYMQGIEGWTEYRRLDFGLLQQPAGGALDGDGNVPLRMRYPTDEQNLNADAYKAAVSQQGADLLNTNLWWDVN